MTRPRVSQKPSRANVCTVVKRDGPFCDKPGVELAPFPICAGHLVDAHLFVMEATHMSEQTRQQAEAALEANRAIIRGRSKVYYVRERDGAIKIGYSTNLRTRISGLRLKHEALLAIEPGGRDLEAVRHQQFAHLRHGRSEDFAPGEDLLSHIAMLVEHYGPPIVPAVPTSRT